MAASSYHLWLKPAGAAYDTLASVIREWSAKLGAPVFEPHVTLLGHLDGSEAEHRRRIRDLARQLQPLGVALANPAYGDEYFQCVFMKAEKSATLMEAHGRACCLFNRTDAEEYMPHVSLVYGLYPASLKQAVAAALPSDLRMTFDVDDLYLIRSDSDDPKDWYEIEVVSLGQADIQA